MFYLHTLTALTVIFMSTSSSLFAMNKNFSEEENSSISNSSLSKKNRKEEIFEIISKHKIDDTELDAIKNQFYVLKCLTLADRGFCIRSVLLREKVQKKGEEFQQLKKLLKQEKKHIELNNLLITLNKVSEIEKEEYKKIINAEFAILEPNSYKKIEEKGKLILFLPEDLMKKKDQLKTSFLKNIKDLNLLKNCIEHNKKNFLLDEYSSIYENNSDSFFEKIKDFSFFKKTLDVFFIEEPSYFEALNLYKREYNETYSWKAFEETINFGYLTSVLPLAFPSQQDNIEKILNKMDAKVMLWPDVLATEHSITDVCTLFSLFEEDKNKQPLPFLYFLLTRFLAEYGTPKDNSKFAIIHRREDEKANVFKNINVISKSISPIKKKNGLNKYLCSSVRSLFLDALALRSLTLIKKTQEKNKKTKNFSSTDILFECPFDEQSLYLLAQEFIKETQGDYDKQKKFRNSLQTAIILFGMLPSNADENTFDQYIEFLSSVKYEVELNFNLEDKQNTMELEILRNAVLYDLLEIKLKKTKNKTLQLIEKNLSFLENFILHVNTYPKEHIKELSTLLDLLPFAKKRLHKKNQLAEKYELLEKLQKEDEAEEVYKEYKKEVDLLKERKEKEKQLKSKNKNNIKNFVTKQIKKQNDKKQNDKKQEEISHKTREEISSKNKTHHQSLFKSVNNFENLTSSSQKEEKFIIQEITVKEKRKGEEDPNRVKEKENIKKKLEVNTNETSKKEENNSKDSEYSQKAKELSKKAKNILNMLFAPYYGKERKGGKITWGQIEILQEDITTLLNSAGFVLEAPKNGSHFKVKRKGKLNHLDSIPIHDRRIKAIYLRNLSELLAREGFYPQDLKEKLEELLGLSL
jgi:hypothetical protein